jgi:hypothetical protein
VSNTLLTPDDLPGEPLDCWLSDCILDETFAQNYNPCPTFGGGKWLIQTT